MRSSRQGSLKISPGWKLGPHAMSFPKKKKKSMTSKILVKTREHFRGSRNCSFHF